MFFWKCVSYYVICNDVRLVDTFFTWLGEVYFKGQIEDFLKKKYNPTMYIEINLIKSMISFFCETCEKIKKIKKMICRAYRLKMYIFLR